MITSLDSKGDAFGVYTLIALLLTISVLLIGCSSDSGNLPDAQIATGNIQDEVEKNDIDDAEVEEIVDLINGLFDDIENEK